MQTKKVTRQVTEEVQVPYGCLRLERMPQGGWLAYFFAGRGGDHCGEMGDGAAYSDDVDMLRGIIREFGLSGVVVGQTGIYAGTTRDDGDGRD